MLGQFADYYENRHQRTREWKQKTSRKVVGYFCSNVPEEIIHAAGMLPVRLTGSKEPITQADAYLQTNVCPFARSCFDLALRGGYDYLDGMVIPHTCDIITHLYDLWKRRIPLPYTYFLNMPHLVNENSMDLFCKELVLFRRSLEEWTGQEIMDEAIARSVNIYNENRSLLREVSDRRRGFPPALGGADFLEASMVSAVMPKEEHSALLRQVLAKEQASSTTKNSRPRVLLSGSMIDNTDLPRLIESCGADLVSDDLCTGSRYYWDLTDTSKGLLEGLANRYLGKVPCARTVCSGERVKRILEMRDRYEVDGIIVYAILFCDPHLYEYPLLKKKLEEAGVPVLFLEGDYTLAAKGQIKTRIEAFVETIEKG